MNWKNITLAQFRQLDEINNSEYSEMDKVLFSACVVFNKTEYELDNTDPRRVLKLTSKLTSLFETPYNPKAVTSIGKYHITYDISKITFGQYIELAFFLGGNAVQNAHYILATLSNLWLRKSKTSDHRRRAEYFLTRPILDVMGSVNRIITNYVDFNNQYSKLFGVDKEVGGDVSEQEFNKRYGWIYSASQVAEYERITLDEAFALPVRQALNDLAYLKAKSKYEIEQIRKSNKTVA